MPTLGTKKRPIFREKSTKWGFYYIRTSEKMPDTQKRDIFRFFFAVQVYFYSKFVFYTLIKIVAYFFCVLEPALLRMRVVACVLFGDRAPALLSWVDCLVPCVARTINVFWRKWLQEADGGTGWQGTGGLHHEAAEKSTGKKSH